MDLLSPRNSELPKSSSISSLRDALLATTSIASSSQQHASYSSPRMAEHQLSPVTPESGPAMISPQVSVTGPTRQDSQLSASGQSEQDASQQSYSRQNSAVPGVKGDAPNTPHPAEGGGTRVSPLQVESILGIKGDQPPLSNSIREGGGSGSKVNSPLTQSPLGGNVTPNVVAGMQDGQSPAPVRPELLGFPAKSPSFRSIENQPSPLTEDGKSVSYLSSRSIPGCEYLLVRGKN